MHSRLKTEESVCEKALANNERVRTLIDGEIAASCASLKKFKVPRDLAFIAPCTAANDMLTPKMSIRRHVVTQTYEEEVGELYAKGREPWVDVDGSYEKFCKTKAA